MVTLYYLSTTISLVEIDFKTPVIQKNQIQ